MSRIDRAGRNVVGVLSLLTIGMLLGCSTEPMVAGGSDNPDFLTGVVVFASGAPAAGTRVVLLPHDHDPLSPHAAGTVKTDTTGDDGRYAIRLPARGVYHMQATHAPSGQVALMQNISAGSTGFVDRGSDTLHERGAVRCILPDTVDTVNGYLAIEGTTCFRRCNGGTPLEDGWYTVTLDTVPPGTLGAVVFVNGSQRRRMTEFTPVQSNETSIVGVPDTLAARLRPVWSYPVLVGASRQTVSHFGSTDSLRRLIDLQLGRVNALFNDSSQFAGVVRFTAESLWVYDGQLGDAVSLPPQGYAVRLLYDGFVTTGFSNWYRVAATACMVVDVAAGMDFFDAGADRDLTWILGLSRGCVGLEHIGVNALANPVNGQGYAADPSIMTNPHYSLRWDSFNTRVVNYHGPHLLVSRSIVNDAVPATMAVQVHDATRAPVAQAAVNLYPAPWMQSRLDSVPVLGGTTGADGVFLLPHNPFRHNGAVEVVYGNFLVEAIAGADTAYAWLPLTAPGEAWFVNPDTVFVCTLELGD